MPELMQVPFANAEEAWAIYDTIQIRKDVTGREGYATYNALGLVDEWPFMDQRKADIGIAYTNRDSNEGLEYVFHAYSLGVRFVAPLGKAEPYYKPDDEIIGPANPLAHLIFSAMGPEHVGLVVRVMQDDKLIHTVTLAPDGAGPGPVSGTGAGGLSQAVVYANNNGEPVINNRWKWPVPISIPRGATFSIRLKPSSYFKRLLAAMPGPTGYTFSLDGTTEISVPAAALIRVDMIGKREVQQRNAIHR